MLPLLSTAHDPAAQDPQDLKSKTNN